MTENNEIKCPRCGWQPLAIENMLPIPRSGNVPWVVSYRCGTCRRVVAEVRVIQRKEKPKNA